MPLQFSRMIKHAGSLGLSLLLGSFPALAQDSGDSASIHPIEQLNKSSTWTLLSEIPLAFDTYHPQGLVKVGDYFFLSSVETKERPVPMNDSRYDRTTGAGTGHLFKIDSTGKLVDQTTLGEGAMYHPGGIDFDGESLWVSVAEYRPNSQSIVYRVDPDTMTSSKVFRFDDHLGAVVRDTKSDYLIAVSWGSRKFYGWPGIGGDYANTAAVMTLNASHYIDYQDCQYVAQGKMLCSGLSSYPLENGATFKMGGLELIDLSTMQPSFQLPVTLSTESGALLTQNPFYAEQRQDSDLILYFVPEDNESVIYGYSVVGTLIK